MNGHVTRKARKDECRCTADEVCEEDSEFMAAPLPAVGEGAVNVYPPGVRVYIAIVHVQEVEDGVTDERIEHETNACGYEGCRQRRKKQRNRYQTLVYRNQSTIGNYTSSCTAELPVKPKASRYFVTFCYTRIRIKCLVFVCVCV